MAKRESSYSTGSPETAIVAADAWPSSLAARMLSQDTKIESRRRLVEARTYLFRSEQDLMSGAGHEANESKRAAAEINERAALTLLEARAIEAEADARVRVILRQAELERRLAERIRNIAERSALAVLDRMKEASDSMMGWAETTGKDMGALMREEAANQVARKVSDINAVKDAMEDEQRAGDLLDMAAQMRSRAA